MPDDSGIRKNWNVARVWIVLLIASAVLVGGLTGPTAARVFETWISDWKGADTVSHENTNDPSDLRTEDSSRTFPRPTHYNSGNDSEKVSTLPVPIAADETHKRVIFSLIVPELAAGDILQVMSEFQVTNDLGYNVMCMSQVILAENENAVVGREITEANGRNVTPAAHHDSFPKVGSLTVDTEGTKYVNVVAWCAASNAEPGASVTIDADYGRLSIIRY